MDTKSRRRLLGATRGSLTLMTCCVLVASGVSQPEYRHTIQPTPIGARMIAFGDAYSASAYDVTGMFSNPASLSFLRSSMVSANRTRDWDAGAITDNIAVPIAIARNHRIALGATVDHTGYQQPFADDKAQFLDYGLDLAYAVSLLPSLSVGLQMSGRIMEVEGDTHKGGWISFGVFYYPSSGISYGVRVKGFGSGLEYGIDEKGSRIARPAQLPRSAEIGAEMRYPALAREPWFTLAISTERLITNEATRMNGAIELVPWYFLMLRAGYTTVGTIRSMRWGVTLRVGGVRLEYAIAPGPPEQRYDAMTLTYAWGVR